MKLELKNVKVNKAFSKETLCFKADLYVNGKMAAECENSGDGGPTFYLPVNKKLTAEAEKWALKQDPFKVDFQGEIFELDSDLELWIDDLIEKHLSEKKSKKKVA